MNDLLYKLGKITHYQIDNFFGLLKFGPGYLKVWDKIDCAITVQRLLEHTKPQVVYDIGANCGLWSLTLSKLDKNLKYVCLFEPQTDCVKELERINLGSAKKKIFNFGLGNKNFSKRIKGGTASASIFSANCNQEKYFPHSIKRVEQETEIFRLDDIVKNNKLPIPDLIKIDVQGYELNVLKGGIKTFSKARFIVVELSYRKFYNGQPSISEVMTFLENNNFVMISKGYEWWSNRFPGELLQVDGIFVNKKYEK